MKNYTGMLSKFWVGVVVGVKKNNQKETVGTLLITWAPPPQWVKHPLFRLENPECATVM